MSAPAPRVPTMTRSPSAATQRTGTPSSTGCASLDATSQSTRVTTSSREQMKARMLVNCPCSRHADQVLTGEGSAYLLHRAALVQSPKVEDEEAGLVEQCGDLGLGLRVVTGYEDHALAARLVRVRAEHGCTERVAGLDHACGSDEIGDHFARGASVQVDWVEVVGRVHHDPLLPLDPLDGLRDVRPHHSYHDEVSSSSLRD